MQEVRAPRSRSVPRSVVVVGSGYVGLTAAACLAQLGHQVQCTDVINERVQRLQRGEVPILERGLLELVHGGLASGRLSFDTDNKAAARTAEIVFLCVPTPPADDGTADLSFVRAAAAEIVRAYDPAVDSNVCGIEVFPSAVRACDGSDVLVLTTEWEEFRSVDLRQVAACMGHAVVFDTRNLLDESAALDAGLAYEGLGFAPGPGPMIKFLAGVV